MGESEDAGSFWRADGGLPVPIASTLPRNVKAGIPAMYDAWRNYEDRMSHLQAIIDGCNGVASIENIGKTHEGHDIKAVRITGGSFKKGMPRVLLTFQLHAREWIAGMTGIYTVEKAVEKAANDPSWLQ